MIDFDEAFFKSSEARYTALQEHLSEPALERFAREVVKRLGSRAMRLAEGGDVHRPSTSEVQVLCNALLHPDPSVAREMVRSLQARNVTLEILFQAYLGPASERLGTMWDNDRISFGQVTLGVSRILELVHKLRAALPPAKITKSDMVLFATVPGETHSLGVEMATELFRQRGWDVEVMVGGSHGEIIERIDSNRYLMLGLSASGRRTAEALAVLIHSVRTVDPSLYIVASGVVVREEPDLLALAQPDYSVSSVDDALLLMDRLSTGVPRGA